MKTRKTMLLAVLLAISLGFNSCVEDFAVMGNGDRETETRWTSSFSKVKSGGIFQIEIIPGDDYSVEVSAESNLLPYIVTDVDGNTLEIRTRGAHNLHNNLPMKIYITTPRLKAIGLSGSGSMKTGSFESDEFVVTLSGSGEIETGVLADNVDIRLSGSGRIKMSGECNHGDFVISGSGKIMAFGLEQQSCHSTISGSGDLFVNVEDFIDVKISGSGNLHFIGSPDIHSSISGSGKVINDN